MAWVFTRLIMRLLHRQMGDRIRPGVPVGPALGAVWENRGAPASSCGGWSLTAAPWDSVPLLKILAWLQRETGPSGKEASGAPRTGADRWLGIFKRCTSQLQREKPPPGNREKEQNCQGRVLVEYLIPEKGKSVFTVGLALTCCCL